MSLRFRALRLIAIVAARYGAGSGSAGSLARGSLLLPAPYRAFPYIQLKTVLQREGNVNRVDKVHESISQFIKHFAEKGIPESVSAQAYHLLQENLPVPRDFPLSPSDDFCDTFGVIGEDLELLVEDLAWFFNRCLPTKSFSRRGKPVIRTVDDIVIYIYSLPYK